MFQLKYSNQLQSEVWQGYQTNRITYSSHSCDSLRSNRACLREHNGNKALFIVSLVNTIFVVRRQSQSRPSHGRCTSRSQDGHLSKTVMSEAWRQLFSRPRNGHRYLSSGCTIYPTRLLDMVQGFIADLQNPTNQSHSRNSQFSERTRPWMKSLQGIQRGRTAGALDQVRGSERPWTSHLLICLWHHETDSFWRETHTTVTFCDTSVCTTF